MQNETSVYEVPSHRLLMDHEGRRVGEGRELGEAEVVSTLFGNVRVRIIRKGDNSRRLWPFFALAVLALMVALWLQRPALFAPEPSVTAVTPVPTDAQALPVPQLPEQKIVEQKILEQPASAPPAITDNTAQTIAKRRMDKQQEQSVSMVATENKPSVAVKPKVLPVDPNAHSAQPPVEAERRAPLPVAAPLQIKPATADPALQISKSPAQAAPGNGEKGGAAISPTGGQQPVAQPVQP